MDSKKGTLIIVGVVIVVLLLIAAVFLTLGLTPSRNPFERPYSMVYLSTGEIYIGKLSTFPRMRMTDGHLLQVVRDPNDETKANFQLVPVKETLWGSEKLLLNRDQVMFYGPIGQNSKVAEALKQSPR